MNRLFAVSALVGIVSLYTIVNASDNIRKYDYKIIEVVDGDTVKIAAPFLPVELGQTLNLRILHIDTPEKGYQAKCAKEKEKANEAKKYVETLLNKSKNVSIIFRKWDKYGGRVLGDVFIDGKYLSAIMLEEGYAVEYYGKRKSKNWCK